MTLQQSPDGQDLEELSPARRQAETLIALLESRNIPALVWDTETGAALVTVYTGLVARCDGLVVRWHVPDPNGERQRPLNTYAHDLDSAANRLADHYRLLQSVPLSQLLQRPVVLARARELLSDARRNRASPC